MITVKKMHQITSQNETPLLSSYAGDWWAEYVENYTVFDTIFTKMFKTFEYFDQESSETEEEITADFIDTVYAWLMMNDKRYSNTIGAWYITIRTDDKGNFKSISAMDSVYYSTNKFDYQK